MFHIIAARYHGGDGYTEWLFVRWLWNLVGWWSIPIATSAFFIFAFIKRLLGIGDDD